MEWTELPDFVATMEIVNRGDRRQETLRHHGGWLRVDGVHPRGPVTRYENRSRFVEIRVYRAAADGSLWMLRIDRGRAAPWSTRELVKTDQTAECLDEPCAVWHDYYWEHGVRKFDPIRVLVSRDGIELRREYGHGWTAQVTALTRRPVSPEEASPPADLLDWRTWPAFVATAPPRPAGSAPDFVVRGHDPYLPYLKDEDALRVTRRRRYPWTYFDAVHPGRSRILVIENDYENRGVLGFGTSREGEFERLIVGALTPPVLRLREQDWREMGKTETILGETCRLIGPGLGIVHAAHSWITADGIPLQIIEEPRSDRPSWRAIEFQRRSPELSDVMPPAEILDPAKWGLTR